MPNLNELRAYERQATPAPWYTNSDPELPRNAENDIEWPDHLGQRLPSHWDYYLGDNDANLIVSLRNSFPVIADVVEASRQLLNAWNSDAAFAARARLNSALQRLEDI